MVHGDDWKLNEKFKVKDFKTLKSINANDRNSTQKIYLVQH